MPKPKKGSLKGKLAALVNPTPSTDFDPEDADFYDRAAAGSGAEDSGSDDSEEETYRPVAVSRSSLRTAAAMSDPVLTQGVYAGTVRQKAGTKFEADEGGDDDHSDSGSSGAAWDNVDEGSGDDEEEADGGESSDEMQEEEEQQEEEDDDEPGLGDESALSIFGDLLGDAAAGGGAGGAAGDAGASSELEQAFHTRNQKRLWDEYLEMRIGLQRLVRSAARLPQPALGGGSTGIDAVTLGDFVEHDRRCAKRLKAVDGGLGTLLRTLLRLRDATTRQNPALPQAPSGSDGTHDDVSVDDDDLAGLWREVDRGYRSLAPYRDEVLEHWHRKSQVASGASMLLNRRSQQGGLGVGAGVMTQVRAVLADSARMHRRSFMRADVTNVLGRRKRAGAGAGAGAGADADDDASRGAASTDADAGVDAEVFDDAEFYQQQLKEFIESGGGYSANAEMVRELAKDTKLRRTSKKVDRRASKGRKIRYDVHAKLQNFMFPEPEPVSMVDTHEFYRSLFGTVRQSASADEASGSDGGGADKASGDE
eukprot:g2944.t1